MAKQVAEENGGPETASWRQVELVFSPDKNEELQITEGRSKTSVFGKVTPRLKERRLTTVGIINTVVAVGSARVTVRTKEKAG